MSLMIRRGGIPIQIRSTHPTPVPSLQIWRDAVGSVFLYTAANWGAVTWYLEVYMRSTSAKALARLCNITLAAEVSNSVVTVDAGSAGVLSVPTRVRSSALTLVDGNSYRIQYGVQDGGAGAFVSAKLIAI